MGQHAMLSPSSAKKWMGCPGSPFMERGLPDSGSEYADEGTAAHFLASQCLLFGNTSADYRDRLIVVPPDGQVAFAADVGAPGRQFVVDQDMVTAVDRYVDAVRGYAKDGRLFVEQRLSISDWTQELAAFGTTDAVILTSDGELIVVDLKYGMGELVSPERNPQLMIYALAAYADFSLIQDIKSVRLVIHQPRISVSPQEWALPPEDLMKFGEDVKAAAYHCHQVLEHENANTVIHHLRPSDDACRWCRAKADCPKLVAKVAEAVGLEFEALADDEPLQLSESPLTLSQKMDACDLIETWIKAVRGKVEAELLAGHEVPGYKLVQGKRGARAWADPVQAEATLKTMRLKVEEMYDMKLISPTSAEKIFGEKGAAPSVKRWNKLQTLITQKEGGPSVAPASDKRPVWTPPNPVNEFADETGEDMA